MKRILIALDKFKGSLSAAEAGRAVERGLRQILSDCAVEVCGIADGGEGTVAALVESLGGTWITLPVRDAIGRSVEARYGWLPGDEAVMEMSAASGLAMVSDQALAPEQASTYGTGQMIADAIRRGAKRIMVGLGGSATNDGGMGMAQALGFVFLDEADTEITQLPVEWERVRRIVPTTLALPEMVAACDVENPLLGERGASAVYGPQKGVKDVAFFDGCLRSLAEQVKLDLGVEFASQAGAGAAGGLGFGLMAFCGASLRPGFALVAEVLDLEKRMDGMDLVITGEGKLDEQSLCGKGPVGVAMMAKERGLKVLGIAGLIQAHEALGQWFDGLIQTKPEGMTVAEAMSRGAELIEESVVRSADMIRERVL